MRKIGKKGEIRKMGADNEDRWLRRKRKRFKDFK